MAETSRRDALFPGLAATTATVVPASAKSADAASPQALTGELPARAWKRGIEGQRKADLGDGRYINPVLAGQTISPTDGEYEHSGFRGESTCVF